MCTKIVYTWLTFYLQLMQTLLHHLGRYTYFMSPGGLCFLYIFFIKGISRSAFIESFSALSLVFHLRGIKKEILVSLDYLLCKRDETLEYYKE